MWFNDTYKIVEYLILRKMEEIPVRMCVLYDLPFVDDVRVLQMPSATYHQNDQQSDGTTCLEEGIMFQKRKSWYHESRTVHIKADTARQEILK